MRGSRGGDGREKRSVSVAIEAPDRPGDVLVVRRPDDDPELPGIWGLPAASLRPAETWAEAARRAARQKLDVELADLRELQRGRLRRERHTLVMRLFAARLREGPPRLLRPDADVTRYTDWRWGDAGHLRPGAEAGSLCCRLYLDSVGGGPDTGK